MEQHNQIENIIEDCVTKIMDFSITPSYVKKVLCDEQKIKIELKFPFPLARLVPDLTVMIQSELKIQYPQAAMDININWKIAAHQNQPSVNAFPGIKNVIAVGSGKGGVGKSTTAVNLALALSAEGARVGLLDADIYGPNQPTMLGVAEQRPASADQKKLQPVMSYGIQSMSIGYLIDPQQAMIWRGPMVSGALQQLLHDTEWDDIDYLIIDLPPGTGDIQLTLVQKIPLTGAVIVTTPQDIALLDAQKAISMFNKVRVPVLGIIENMSMHRCEACGHLSPIFGEGGGARMAEQSAVELLGQLPLDMSIRAQADKGCPTVVAEPESELAKNYQQIARKIAAKIALQAISHNNIFPQIVIENS